jgi:aldehyde dehydrogenase (NAD+)
MNPQARQDWKEAMRDTLQTHPRASYASLGKQFIAGHWRDGRAGASMADIDPYNGIDIVSIALANRADLDEAFAAAASAQRKWDAVLPAEKAAVFRRAASIMEDRHEEIVSWLIRESGSTRIKAELEWLCVPKTLSELMT